MHTNQADTSALIAPTLTDLVAEDTQPIIPTTATPEVKAGLAFAQWSAHDGVWNLYYQGRKVGKAGGERAGYKMLRDNVITGKTQKYRNLGITDVVAVTAGAHIPGFVEDAATTSNQLAQVGHSLDMSITDEFSISERFAILESFVSSAAYMAVAEPGTPERLAANPMVVITGSGGLGKTHTTIKTLERHGLTRMEDMDEGEVLYGNSKGFVVISGFTTAKALYRKMWQHRDGWVILLDDCDSIFKSEDAINIIKGAGDSGERRIISWNSESQRPDDELPKSFEFKSSIIIITNVNRNKIPQPIRSRAFNADVSMSRAEVIERISVLVDEGNFMAEYPIEAKYDVLDYIQESMDDPKFNMLVKSLNIRTFIVAVKAWMSHNGKNWQRAALYNMASASE